MKLSEQQLKIFNNNLDFVEVTNGSRELLLSSIRIRAEQLGVIFDETDLDNTLLNIEKIYKSHLLDYYHLNPEADWKEIAESYFNNLNLTTREDLVEEIRRIMFAKYLQLNKFIASWDEIRLELETLEVL